MERKIISPILLHLHHTQEKQMISKGQRISLTKHLKLDLHSLKISSVFLQVYENKQTILYLHVFWDSIYGLCQVSVHREGVDPSSMEGVLDLSDHISVEDITCT